MVYLLLVILGGIDADNNHQLSSEWSDMYFFYLVLYDNQLLHLCIIFKNKT